MQSTIVTWNVANWITVVLMVVLMYVALGAVVQLIKLRQGAAA